MMKKLLTTRTSDTAFNFAMLSLRLSLGVLMLLNHGYAKLVNFADLTNKFSDPFGVGRTVSLTFTVFAEFFCAALIVLGLFTRLAAIPLIMVMATAFFVIHNGVYKAGPGSGEMALLYLMGFIAILLAGPGKISLDRLLGK